MVIKIFELMSGLKVNFDKSYLYGSEEMKQSIQVWASMLHCNVGSWPMLYLGAHIGKSPRRVEFWTPLIRKFRKKLQSWRKLDTTLAGRLILKSVLDSIPVYWLNLHRISEMVIKEIDRISKDFLWNGLGPTSKKMHYLKWDKICSSKSVGG